MAITSRTACDLHTHSHFSDGSLSPTQLLALAEAHGLGALALTDHNTVAGLPELYEAATQYPHIQTVAGVELSTQYVTTEGKDKELHMLALFIPHASWGAVADFTADYARRKEESNQHLIEALAADGYVVDYDALKAATPDGNINRAHIAGALCRAGYVATPKEAFASLLSSKGKYYTPPARPNAFDTIDFILSIGAVPVLAHPLLTMTTEETEDFLSQAVAHGLVGMETRYVTYDEATTQTAMKLAQRFGLLESGGSDFHGDAKPDVALGAGKGNLCVPVEIYEALARSIKTT